MLLKINGVVRLARDVEIRYSQSGSAIANFSVVSSKKYKTQSGEQKEDVTFIDCTAFSRLAEICNQYLKKGSQIYIVGELKLDQWTDKDGNKKSKHSVVVENMTMLGGKEDGQAPQQPQQGGYSQPQAQQPNPTTYRQPETAEPPEVSVDEDSIPF